MSQLTAVGTVTNDDGAATPIFTSGADTVTLPLLGGTFNALGGDDKLAYTGGPVTIDGARASTRSTSLSLARRCG